MSEDRKLCLTRSWGERVQIKVGESVCTLTVDRDGMSGVRLYFEAPDEFKINRLDEKWLKKKMSEL